MLRLLSGGGCFGGGADAGHVLVNAFQKIESGTRAYSVTLGFQTHAHDAVKDEGQKADHGMGADAVGQPVVNRRNLDVGFEHATASAAVRSGALVISASLPSNSSASATARVKRL